MAIDGCFSVTFLKIFIIVVPQALSVGSGPARWCGETRIDPNFRHATEYPAEAADAIFSTKKEQPLKKEWLDDRCHRLKHMKGAAGRITKELKGDNLAIRSKGRKEKLHKTISYFTNQKSRMSYYALVKEALPIGSGITEAACKMIVKQRLCQSGMKWRERGVSIILSLRTLERSNRWGQFWGKVSQFGVGY